MLLRTDWKPLQAISLQRYGVYLWVKHGHGVSCLEGHFEVLTGRSHDVFSWPTLAWLNAAQKGKAAQDTISLAKLGAGNVSAGHEGRPCFFKTVQQNITSTPQRLLPNNTYLGVLVLVYGTSLTARQAATPRDWELGGHGKRLSLFWKDCFVGVLEPGSTVVKERETKIRWLWQVMG